MLIRSFRNLGGVARGQGVQTLPASSLRRQATTPYLPDAATSFGELRTLILGVKDKLVDETTFGCLILVHLFLQ